MFHVEQSCPSEESCLCPHGLDIQVSSKHILVLLSQTHLLIWIKAYMMACSLSYCIFLNALVMQLYVILSVTNIDFTLKTNNSWYKSPITAWNMPFERYDSYLSPNVKKQSHYPFFHVYFNGFLPPFNFLLHPWKVAYTDNILSNINEKHGWIA